MRIPFFFGLFLLYIPVFAQQTPYQPFEVDSIATPRGGIAAFNTFIQANLRKPIAAQAQGTGGVVLLSGVLEPDGHITNATVTKSFRPDCDREAMRVFKLFRAWKPAQKQGNAVRQTISLPIMFKPNTPFNYEQGAQISYLDADINLLPDSMAGVRFKELNPIDSLGIPTGDHVIYKLINNKWEEYARDSLVRKLEPTDVAGEAVYTIGHQLSVQKLKGVLFTVSTTGQILTERHFEKGQLTDVALTYYANGVLTEKREYVGNKQPFLGWYPNGQIKLIQEIIADTTPSGFFGFPTIDRVLSFWDSTGRQSVKDGNGTATYYRSVKSYTAPTQQTLLTEQGAYKNSLKQGLWTGHYADNSYSYEEQYDRGVLVSGKSSIAGQETNEYRIDDHPPVFPGGMLALREFISKNIQYPLSALKDRAEGQVVVSFVVCEDGTLCDYTVVEKVHPSLDREALRVIKKTTGNWIPGVSNGKRVRVKYNAPINFHLN
ncbi:TonB family protein [Spirosoma sp. SC4-14]|uniref:TonB family protein n=1 Tax=Spirosoma sp. SC4-14 TaxID=3128900 RepID=UPI0030CE4F84